MSDQDGLPQQADVVFVGAGHNALVAAAYLAGAGRSVCLLALVTSVRQAEAGLLPEHPSIAWHEPTAVDPTRAPAGKAVVRLQVLDAPHTPCGDAAGTSYGAAGLIGAATWPGPASPAPPDARSRGY